MSSSLELFDYFSYFQIGHYYSEQIMQENAFKDINFVTVKIRFKVEIKFKMSYWINKHLDGVTKGNDDTTIENGGYLQRKQLGFK